MIEFVVYGVAAPASYRTTKQGRMYEAPRPKEWKQLVQAEAGRLFGERSPMTGPLRLTVDFWFKRPKGHLGTGRNEGTIKPAFREAMPTVMPDLTSCVRAVEDALTGIVYDDDCQIVEQATSKNYVDDKAARVEVRVEPAPFRAREQRMDRVERLSTAIGESAADIRDDEQLELVLGGIHPREVCVCGQLLPWFDVWCPNCGRATFTPFRRPRAAAVPQGPEMSLGAGI